MIELEQFDQYAVRVVGSGRVTLRNEKFLRKFDKIVVDHRPGTTHTIQFLKAPNNAENLSPVKQQTNPEQAKDPPTAKRQTPQPYTKRQVLTGAQFTQRPPETPPIKAPLKFNRPPNESLGDEKEPLLDKDIMPHIISAQSPDKKSKCCDKLNETGSPNESPLAKTPRITHGLPQTIPERNASPVRLGDYNRF